MKIEEVKDELEALVEKISTKITQEHPVIVEDSLKLLVEAATELRKGYKIKGKEDGDCLSRLIYAVDQLSL